MTYKDKWSLLLSEMRFRDKSPTIPADGRNPFENDYGRLISSAPIRRLQDKTQVFPLEQSDFTRTRLTHSLEVSYIASSIGQSIEKILSDFKDITIDQKGLLSSLLRVSGLVHDLGNPPFGHFGEEAMKKFFNDYFNYSEKDKLDDDEFNEEGFNKNGFDKDGFNKDEIHAKGLNRNEVADLKNFDGNVQTFRILSKLYYFGDEFGYNLTYSSLASIIKYPSSSLEGNHGRKYTEIRKKKFGYFVTEKDKYDAINTYLNLNNRRSPVVYLLEAADDIAYSAADIEDGVKLGIIHINDVRHIFEANLSKNKVRVLQEFDDLCERYSKDIDKSIIIQKFRIFTQRVMIEEIISAFKGNYSSIMEGTLENEIIDISNASDVRKAYKNLQYMVFDDKTIAKKEIAGWEAIYGLLGIFVKASESSDFKANGNTFESRLFKIISSSHRTVYQTIEKYENEKYKRLQLIVDFISGMTDSYAINLYQELKGIKL